MSKIIVIYHRSDYDGVFCREIANKFLPDAEFIGWDYGDPTPKIPDGIDALYILDLSVPDLMLHPKLIWIDHHKSAIDQYGSGTIPITQSHYCIDGVAACRLAWQWFTIIQHNAQNATNEALQVPLPTKQQFIDRAVSEPLAVRLAGEWDIWDHRDPDAAVFQFALDSAEKLFWAQLLSEGELTRAYVDALLKDGRAAQRCFAKRDADVIAHRSFTLKWEGLTFLSLNTARCNSNTFKSGVKPEHDALMGFYFNGEKWTVSLYHAPHRTDLDLSKIAVKYGGGGHKGACGFQVVEPKNIGLL